MKKIVSFFLISSMLFSLSACGKKEEQNIIEQNVVENVSVEQNEEKEEILEEKVIEEEISDNASKKNENYINNINKIYNYDWTPGSLEEVGTGLKNKNVKEDLESVSVLTSYDFFDYRQEEFNLLGVDYDVSYHFLNKIDNKEVENELNNLISKKIKEILSKELNWKFDDDKYDDYSRRHYISVYTNVWGNVISCSFYSNAYMDGFIDEASDFLVIDDESSYLTYDMKNKKILKLSDMFYEDVKYVDLINNEINKFISKNSNSEEMIDFELKRPFLGIPKDYSNFYLVPGNLMIHFNTNNPYFKYQLAVPINYYTYQNEIFIEDPDTDDYLRTDVLEVIPVFESSVKKGFDKINPYLSEEVIVNRIDDGLKEDVVNKINKELKKVENEYLEDYILENVEIFKDKNNNSKYISSFYTDMINNEKTTVVTYYYSVYEPVKDDNGNDNYDLIYVNNKNVVFDNKTGERLTVSDLFNDDEIEILKEKLSEDFGLDQNVIDSIGDFDNFYYNENYNISFEFNNGNNFGFELSELK